MRGTSIRNMFLLLVLFGGAIIVSELRFYELVPKKTLDELRSRLKKAQRFEARVKAEAAATLPPKLGADFIAEPLLPLPSSVSDVGKKTHPVENKMSVIIHHATHVPKLKPEWKITPDMKGKFFVYQPSGGWGNQRLILGWAMIAANAMNRTLILPVAAHHSNFWQNFNKHKPEDVTPMHKILDIDALSKALINGVRVSTLTIPDLEILLEHRTWLRYEKPQVLRGTTKENWWGDKFIRSQWMKKRTPDFIFWHKTSMWKCCGAELATRNWLNRHIIFHKHLKALAKLLAIPLGKFNAVHVRRNDHVGGKNSDRASPEVYYARHELGRFDKNIPLYIATDEVDHAWFDPLKNALGFKRLMFWNDLNKGILDRALERYPLAMRNDVLGFIEQLICANGVMFEGSVKSTFSFAIDFIKRHDLLRELHFQLPSRPVSMSPYQLPPGKM